MLQRPKVTPALATNIRLHALVFLLTVVVIGMAQDRYSVNEDDGSVMVCMQLEEGELQRDVNVTLSTNDITAVG